MPTITIKELVARANEIADIDGSFAALKNAGADVLCKKQARA